MVWEGGDCVWELSVCGVGVCRLCGRGGGVEIVKYVCVCVKGGSEVYQSI